jgi:hypothetical protein
VISAWAVVGVVRGNADRWRSIDLHGAGLELNASWPKELNPPSHDVVARDAHQLCKCIGIDFQAKEAD